MSNETQESKDSLKIPDGFGLETGLDPSIPAVRVWGIASIERAYSGNEARGTNEAFTDLEAFVRPPSEVGQQPEFDARARIRATKFNYVRESYFRELIRRVAEPYLKEVVDGSVGAGESQVPGAAAQAPPQEGNQDASVAKPYSNNVNQVFEQVLGGLVEPEKKERYRSFFRALLIKTAACSPATPCGACPACIAEGSAATTQAVGVSLPHNWEKKFKETDFKTFRTARSAAEDLLINVDGQVLEPSLTEAVVRNRMPRAGDHDTATSVENTAQSGRVDIGGQMILREHMFKGAGYIKTTLFNPTRLELAMLAYEHLVEDVRRGAKTSSGAGIWSWCRSDDRSDPLLVLDEVRSSRGFVVHPPIAGVPLEVTRDDQGIQCCFNDPLGAQRATSAPQSEADGSTTSTRPDASQPKPISAEIWYDASGNSLDGTTGRSNNAALVRYIGTSAVNRLGEYLKKLDDLETNGTPEKRFRSLAQHAASVIARLIRPRRAIQALQEEFRNTVDQAAPAASAPSVPPPPGANAGRNKPTRRKKPK